MLYDMCRKTIIHFEKETFLQYDENIEAMWQKSVSHSENLG